MTDLRLNTESDHAGSTPAPGDAPPGRRELNRTRLRHAVHATAWQLVNKRGYDEVTVEDIASGAGISVATFYRHFSGKDDLVTRRWLAPERFGYLLEDVDPTLDMADAVASLLASYAEAVDVYDVSLATRLKTIYLDSGLRLAMARGRDEDVGSLADLFARIVGCGADEHPIQIAAAVTITGRATTMSYWAAHLAGSQSLSAPLAQCAEALRPTLAHCEDAARATLTTTRLSG